MILRNCIILAAFALGPNVWVIPPLPMVVLLWFSTVGHSSRMCLTVSWVLHALQTGGGPFGRSMRWQCVRRVWPILSLVIVTSVCLSLYLGFHSFTSPLMVLSLFAGG